MRKMKKGITTLLVGSLMLMGCGSSQKAASVNELAGEWEIVRVNGKSVQAEETPFLGFNVAESQLYGNAGCNSLMGTLETNADKPEVLSFGAVGSTQRFCADMATEDAILQAIEKVRNFSFSNDVLFLKDESGHPLFELKKRL
ncbi:MAG: META domain-containing protein [Bacteroidaceae bacterium]|nr:META domain-containing protein [Bacteroidaceae bacterium]